MNSSTRRSLADGLFVLHFFLPCCCLVNHPWLTLCNSMDYSPPGSSVPGISQVRILEWVAISFSRGSSQPWDRTHMSCIGRRILCLWATREAPFLTLQDLKYRVYWTTRGSGGFIHSYSKYLLCPYYLQGTGWDPASNKMMVVVPQCLVAVGSWPLISCPGNEAGRQDGGCLPCPPVANRTLEKGHWGSWSLCSINPPPKFPF